MKKSIYFLGVAFSCVLTSCSSDSDDPEVQVAPVGGAEVVQDGFSFTEGPAVDKNGNVYFTDQPNDKIHKWDAATGVVTEFLSGTGRANGMAFDSDGNIIACADMYGEVWKIKPDGSHEVLIDNYNGKLLNGPNDVWINPVTGGMYITDPIFPRGYWDADDVRRTNNFEFDDDTQTYSGSQLWPPVHSEQTETGKGGHVYYLAPDAVELVRVTTMAQWDADVWPNGVVGTPDGKKLYVNRWAGDNLGGTIAFDINSDGTLTNMSTFSTIGGDGMSMDSKGDIYISNGFGVVVINPEGDELFRIGSVGGTTNNVFAGADQKTLFITNVTGVATVSMSIGGVEKF